MSFNGLFHYLEEEDAHWFARPNTYKKQLHMKYFLSRIALIALIFANAFSVSPVQAAGVVVTLLPSTGTAPTATVGATWTRTSATTYVTGTTITLTITPAIISVSSTSAIDLDHNGANDASFTSSSTDSSITSITFTVVTTTASQTSFTATSTLTFSSTSTNYSIAVFTSSPVDFGAALFYANGGNQVAVTAVVPATLSFSIRNNLDTTTTNSCSLGTLSTASTSTCAYRLRIATNASSGFTATIQADHDFGTGTATMTNIGDNGSFAAGTEAYGIAVLTGATVGGRNGTTGAFDQPVTEASSTGFTFSADSSPVPTSTALTFISYAGAFNTGNPPSTTSTSYVLHAAAINAGTAAGNYTQTITYLVTGTY